MAIETQGSKPIKLSGHARLQLPFRGVTEDEVIEAIRTGIGLRLNWEGSNVAWISLSGKNGMVKNTR